MTRIATLLLACASVAACAPLSQAGLVYASRGQAGVTIAAGTAETPGLDLNIGMKSSDFAYIPVVVGRPCELNRATNCDQTLIPVFGNHSLTSETPNRPQEGGQPQPSGQPKAIGRNATIQDDAPAEQAQPESPAPVTQQQLSDVLSKLLATNTYRDSYSVYGTFNSSGNGSAPTTGGSGSAGLSMGRVFSTGVAAQHLTEGQQAAMRTQSYAQCLASVENAVKSVTPAESQNTLRQELLRGCVATRE
jgi:hypothetical protein